MNRHRIPPFCISLLLGCLLCPLTLPAQYARFEYNTELCSCKALFDSTRYTRQQLENTHEALYFGSASDMNVYPWDFDEVEEVLLDRLDKEYAEQMRRLRPSKIVNDRFWQAERQKVIRYVNACRELRKVTILARINPTELRKYKRVNAECIYYREALIAGGDRLLKAWRLLNEKQKKKNGAPENVQRVFDSRYHSPDRLEYARREVLTFGWWNAANHLLPHVGQEDYEENFDRLFKDIERDCDEP